ncbi:MAG: HAD family phosphatase [Chloroflexi bacterium]|nr:HAD family phosphatase [Chloroflexota bacterium]
MIQAIIWDIGGVLLRTQDWSHRLKWDERLGLAAGSVEELVFNSVMGTAAQLGRVTTEAHWQAIGHKLGLNPTDLAQLRHDFWAGDTFDMALVDFIRSLRPEYQTAVISNAFDDLRDVLTHQFGVADAFDLIVVSAEEGVMKPEAEIYARTLRQLDCAPIQSLFIDDNGRNIAGARAMGMQTLYYERDMDVRGILKEIL